MSTPHAAVVDLAGALDAWRLTADPETATPSDGAEYVVAFLAAAGWAIRPDIALAESEAP